MTTHPLLKFLSCALLFSGLSISLAHAENTPKAGWYSIEYIVFKHNDPRQISQELPSSKALILADHAQILSRQLQKKTFAKLTAKKQLHGVKQRLNTLANYTVIAQGGWSQAIKKGGKLAPVIIQAPRVENALAGTVTLHRGRFLHVDIDLQLSAPTASLGEEPTNYRLKQTRRFKTGQLHYFDHPNFGVIAKVEKLKPPTL